MSEATFASLGATLLARKGGAKPAMRPQWGELPETVADEQLEDLGWNDMGAEEEVAGKAATTNPDVKNKSADVVSINGSINPPATALAANEDADPAPSATDPLIKAKPAKKNSANKAPKSKRKSAKPASKAVPKTAQSPQNSARRAAFTLRLDADRHLKLRLAATMQGVSAQALVTDALDNMLSEIDGLDTLIASMANRIKRH